MKEIRIECPACHGTGLYQGMWIFDCKYYRNKEECWKEFYNKKK